MDEFTRQIIATKPLAIMVRNAIRYNATLVSTPTQTSSNLSRKNHEEFSVRST